ncbi:zeta toxin family protein [Coraliomargarita sp. SDUM461003]|uniref:Zeta toxin family protein n=1 Tax=Thalassobacterium maritimum TaxID=3041265 RepID=A0ABU1ATF6_9BACT|nr:zeta toxin family protein [Coraliomargarita sp. SDUM461003]MDQ8206897.1 zeta toxin family protein [Coraliomargarita sp. SDUM461003]
MAAAATIYVLAGVNGSGKSSIGGAMIESKGNVYYNPDLAAKKLKALHPNMTQSIANGHAWSLGKEMLEAATLARRTFAFETTLGGQTITECLIEAAAQGLKLKVWYAGLESVELNIARVQQRVRQHGHDIPEAAIRQRWNGSRRNLIRLMPHIDSLRLFDNSKHADPAAGQCPMPKLILDLRAAVIVGPRELSAAPEWAKPIIAAALKLYPHAPPSF